LTNSKSYRHLALLATHEHESIYHVYHCVAPKLITH
jgi:hypothetical protein